MRSEGLRIDAYDSDGAAIADAACDAPLIHGTVKWFDVTRGFGFAVAQGAGGAPGGDVLIHFSVLEPHGRRSLPEGAKVVCRTVLRERGLQASEVIEIDLSDAVEPVVRARTAADRSDVATLAEQAGPFEPVRCKWFNRLKGYGFLVRDGDDGDIFVHMETLRCAGIDELMPDDRLRARIVAGRKGPLAVMVEREG